MGDLGPLRTASLFATFASGILGPLLWPLFAGVIMLDACWGDLLRPVGFVADARSTLVGLLIYCGLIAMIGPIVTAAFKHGLKRYLLLLPLLPLWHIALCLSAWLGLLDLLRNPYRWAKTEHGQAKRRMSA